MFKVNDNVIFTSTDSDSKGPIKALVIRLLTDSECDIEDVGNMYLLDTDCGKQHAFEDELQLVK